MSQRTLRIPLRLATSARQSSQPYTCFRCLSTTTTTTTTPQPTPSNAIYASYGPNPLENYDPRLPASARPKHPETGAPMPLKKTDFYLKKPLPSQFIPPQHLQHTEADWIHENERKQRDRLQVPRKIVGVVVSAGKMERTVKVRVPGRRWEPKVGKYFASHTNHLVHDPNSSLIAGDVVELHRLKHSKHVHHVIGKLITPFGVPESERPPIPTADERLATYKEKRFAKLERRKLRRKAAMGDGDAIRELRSRGLDPGDGVEEGKGGKANLQPNVDKTRDSGKGAILGEKGQKLPKGVLPGGKHEVGKIDERAKHNKEKAMRWNGKTEENLLEAKEKTEEVQREKDVSADADAAATVTRGRND